MVNNVQSSGIRYIPECLRGNLVDHQVPPPTYSLDAQCCLRHDRRLQAIGRCGRKSIVRDFYSVP